MILRNISSKSAIVAGLGLPGAHASAAADSQRNGKSSYLISSFAVKSKIQNIYDDSKQNYGAPKITVELHKKGESISERTVGTYMRQMGIRAQWIKPWTITTKDSDFSSELKNILDEQFNPDCPNAVWCSDITYIRTIDGFVYLTSIMDLFSGGFLQYETNS